MQVSPAVSQVLEWMCTYVMAMVECNFERQHHPTGHCRVSPLLAMTLLYPVADAEGGVRGVHTAAPSLTPCWLHADSCSQ